MTDPDKSGVNVPAGIGVVIACVAGAIYGLSKMISPEVKAKAKNDFTTAVKNRVQDSLTSAIKKINP